ncbi:PspC domain-containing protein [Roseiflexus sp.]
MNTTTQRLMRSRTDRMIAGVAGGIGQYLGIDPVIVRLTFVLLVFSGFGLLLYPILWWLMPEELAAGGAPVQSARMEGNTVFVGGQRKPRFDPMTGQPLDPEQEIPIQNVGSPAAGAAADTQARRNRTLGLVLMAIGIFFILKMLIPGSLAPFIFPALLIGAGIMLLRRAA